LDDLPKSLRELLQWKHLILDLEKISSNAAEVLENSKKRGAAQGDIMDPHTGESGSVEKPSLIAFIVKSLCCSR
jgi:hypothetical protein